MRRDMMDAWSVGGALHDRLVAGCGLQSNTLGHMHFPGPERGLVTSEPRPSAIIDTQRTLVDKNQAAEVVRVQARNRCRREIALV